VLAAARRPFVLDLANRRVDVRDSSGNAISISDITPGMYVTVVRDYDQVTITVSPKGEAKNDKPI